MRGRGPRRRSVLLAAVLLLPARPCLQAQEAAANPDSTALLMDEAVRLAQTGRRDALRLAVRLARRVVRRATAAGELGTASMALGISGAFFEDLHQDDSALVAYRRATVLADSSGDQAAASIARMAAGDLFHRLGQSDSAAASYVAAFPGTLDRGDTAGAIRAAQRVADYHRTHNNPSGALSALRPLRRLALARGDTALALEASVRIAQQHFRLDHPDSATVEITPTLAVLRLRGPPSLLGLALHELGVYRSTAGILDSARSLLLEAVPIRRSARDTAGLAATLMEVARVEADLGHYDQALAPLREALKLRLSLRDTTTAIRLLLRQGEAFTALALPDSAIIAFERLERIAARAGATDQRLLALRNLGVLYGLAGRFDDGATGLQQVRTSLTAQHDTLGLAIIAKDLAGLHGLARRTDSVAFYSGEALRLARSAGDTGLRIWALRTRAGMFPPLAIGDTTRAWLREAITLAGAQGDTTLLVETLLDLEESWAVDAPTDSTGVSSDSSRALLTLARRLAEGHGLLGSELRILLDLASRADLEGDNAGADSLYRQSVAVARRLGNPRQLAEALGLASGWARSDGRGSDALAWAHEALQLYRALHDREAEARSLRRVAEALERLPRPAFREAIAYLDSALVIFEARQGTAGSAQARLLAEERYESLYRWQALYWLRLRDSIGVEPAVLGALGSLERNRSGLLLERLRRDPRTGPRAGAEVLGRELARGVRALGVPVMVYLPGLGDTIEVLRIWPDRPVDLVTSVRTGWMSGTPMELLVAIWRQFAGFDHGGGGASLASELGDGPPSRAAAAATASTAAAGQRMVGAGALRALLPGDIEASLPAGAEMVIVPYGGMALFPFAALPLADTTELLGTRYALRYAPSVRALLAIAGKAPARRASVTAPALVVGNPAMPTLRGPAGQEVRLLPLPGAEGEARMVAERLRTRPLVGAAASEAAVRRRLPASRIVHLATHGFAYSGTDDALRSFVALAPGERHDGILRMGELLDDPALTLTADLVVLSACETGTGNATGGEGMVGLQSALLARGARNVLVSLWSVSDEATALLMRRFYLHWLDDRDRPSKAEALRRAQRDVRGDPRFHDPRFWAAFQLVGAG